MTQNILPSLFCSSSVRCVCMTPRRLREGRCWRLGLESTRSQRSLFLPARAQWSWATLTGSSPSLTSGKVSSRWMLHLFFLLGRFGSAQKQLFWTEAPLLRVFCPGSVCVPSIKDVFGQPFSIYALQYYWTPESVVLSDPVFFSLCLQGLCVGVLRVWRGSAGVAVPYFPSIGGLLWFRSFSESTQPGGPFLTAQGMNP